MKKLLPFLAVALLGSAHVEAQTASEPVIKKEVTLRQKPMNERPNGEGVITKTVVLTTAGTLAEALGDEINAIDSLVVEGPVNAADFRTLWQSTFYGTTEVINLEKARIEGGIIPQEAFWDECQYYTVDGIVYVEVPALRRIIFPEGLTHIDQYAFYYCCGLEEINLPSTLRAIGEGAFVHCRSLCTDPLIFPEGFEEIGVQAFSDCGKLQGTVEFPSTLKTIHSGAFYVSGVGAVRFKEGMQTIESFAFAGARLKELTLPNTCAELTGQNLFSSNHELQHIILTDGIQIIPPAFAENCTQLKRIDMPASLLTIGEDSFGNCIRVSEIYCAAERPPFCLNTAINDLATPFDDVPADAKVYVPKGSAELYKNAFGWRRFTNIIETDDFPASGIESVAVGTPATDATVYDLHGRRIGQPAQGTVCIGRGKKYIFRR